MPVLVRLVRCINADDLLAALARKLLDLLSNKGTWQNVISRTNEKHGDAKWKKMFLRHQSKHARTIRKEISSAGARGFE